MSTSTGLAAPLRRSAKPRAFLDRYFYLTMALVIAGVIAAGFSRTVDANLLHPAIPRPAILWLHAAVFTAWLALFLTQSALIRSRNIVLHKRLGLAGIALGATMPGLGIATALVMMRFLLQHHMIAAWRAGFFAIQLADMVLFTTFFVAAVWLRRRPEYHRRLMLCATIALTSAGFGRMPFSFMHYGWFYAWVDGLVVLAMARDLVVIRRVHPAYLMALPLMVAVHAAALTLYLSKSPAWLALVHTMIG